VYDVAALVMIFSLLGLETRSCLKRKVISGFLLFLLFHFVFLHLWLIEVLLAPSPQEIDGRVRLLVFLFDVALLLGWSISRFVFPFSKQDAALVINESRLSLKIAYWGLFACCLLVSAYHLYTVGIPLLGEYVDESRHLARKGHGYIRIFANRGLPLSAAGIMLIYVVKTGGNSGHRGINMLIGLFPAAVCCVVLVATGFRAPLLTFLLLLGLIYSNYSKRFSILRLALAGTALMLLFVAITLFKYRFQVTGGQSGPFLLLGFLRHRVLMELPRVIGYTVSLADAQGLWLGKSYCMDIASALPGPGLSFGDYLLVFVNPDHPFAGLIPLTPSLVGETFLNFGYVGVAVVGILLPLLCHHLENWGYQIGIHGYVFRNIFRIFVANSVTLGFGTLLAARIIPTFIFLLVLLAADALLASAVTRKENRPT